MQSDHATEPYQHLAAERLRELLLRGPVACRSPKTTSNNISLTFLYMSPHSLPEPSILCMDSHIARPLEAVRRGEEGGRA